MNAEKVNLNPLVREHTSRLSPDHALSALVDGELDADQLAALFLAIESETEALANWHTYQVIGDVLRGEAALSTAQMPGNFLATVRERLQSEAAPAQPTERSHHVVQAIPIRAAAANDAVFRWKLLAGVASLAAVMAVSWTVLSGVPSGAGNATSPQLAAAPASIEPSAPGLARTAAPTSNALVVNTGQGPLIRDARLEELLAEHRQNGGMSALQMPTGFIRNATYDAAGR